MVTVDNLIADCIYRLGFIDATDLGASNSWVTITELYQWADEQAKRLAYLAGVFQTIDTSIGITAGVALYNLQPEHVYTPAVWLTPGTPTGGGDTGPPAGDGHSPIIQSAGAAGFVTVRGETHHPESISVTLPNPVGTGNTLIVTFGCIEGPGGAGGIGTVAPFTLTDSLGNTYTLIGIVGTGYLQPGGAAWYATNVAAGADTVTLNFSIQGSDFVDTGWSFEMQVAEYPGTATALLSHDELSVYGAAGNNPVLLNLVDTASTPISLSFGGFFPGPGDVCFLAAFCLQMAHGDQVFAYTYNLLDTSYPPTSTWGTFTQQIKTSTNDVMYFWDSEAHPRATPPPPPPPSGAVNTYLRITPVRELWDLDATYPTTAGAPKRASFDAGAVGQILLYPIPNVDGTLLQVYQEYQPAITAAAPDVTLPSILGDLFSYRMLQGARLKESDARMDEMAAHYGERCALYEAIAKHLYGSGQ